MFKGFSKALMVLFLLSLLGFAGIAVCLGEAAKAERIEADCYYYKVDGTPKSVIIKGTKYKLNPDGSMDTVDRMFLNRFHEEMLRTMEDDDCVVVNKKGEVR